MNIKLRHMPEKWAVNWYDNERIEHTEMFDDKEDAKKYAEQIEKEMYGWKDDQQKQ
jgi:hypothetical protein